MCFISHCKNVTRCKRADKKLSKMTAAPTHDDVKLKVKSVSMHLISANIVRLLFVFVVVTKSKLILQLGNEWQVDPIGSNRIESNLQSTRVAVHLNRQPDS